MPTKHGASIATTAVPFMLFMVASWYGLAQLVGNKRQLRNASSGLEDVEELDPLERMRQRYNLGQQGAVRQQPRMTSLEEELESIKRQVNIYDFDYKPVPRTEDD